MPQKPADKNTGTITAAGAVAWRPGPGGAPEVLLVHRRRYDDWSLPKGKTEPGEALPVTAVREVREEGGARIVLGRRLTQVKYKVSGRPKRVTYWSALVTGVDAGAVPNEEIDEAVWLPEEQARERTSYAQDLEVLDAFAAAPADTVPLIMLRHAKAEPKDEWPGQDDVRPLSARGHRDAEAVGPVLACFAPAAGVFTSPALRCTETVRPYAEAAGVRVQRTDALRIARTGRADWSQFLASVLASERPAILCGHRENLPGLIAGAAAGLGAAAPSGCDDPLPTAGFCLLHVAAGKLVGADRYDLSEL